MVQNLKISTGLKSHREISGFPQYFSIISWHLGNLNYKISYDFTQNSNTVFLNNWWRGNKGEQRGNKVGISLAYKGEIMGKRARMSTFSLAMGK